MGRSIGRFHAEILDSLFDGAFLCRVPSQYGCAIRGTHLRVGKDTERRQAALIKTLLPARNPGVRVRHIAAMFPFGYRSQNSGAQLFPLCQSKQHRLQPAASAKMGGNMRMNHQELPMDLLALDLLGLELTCASAR